MLVSNALIGILQELRAKRVLDRLAVLNAPRAQVIRDGTERDIAVEDVVLDDLIVLRRGDQIVTDGVVRSSAGLQADESLLTGESHPIDKGPGDPPSPAASSWPAPAPSRQPPSVSMRPPASSRPKPGNLHPHAQN